MFMRKIERFLSKGFLNRCCIFLFFVVEVEVFVFLMCWGVFFWLR